MGNVFSSKGDDKNLDGVNTYPANADRLESYVEGSRELSAVSAPVLLAATNPHERLYMAAFDGTGNDMVNDPVHMSNVGRIISQIDSANKSGNNKIAYGYVEGPGTQDNFFVRMPDLITGHTYEARIEEMYEKFTKQAAAWLKEDPNVQIRLADIGFSRGAEQAAGFARLVHERGIQNPEGRKESRDEDGRMRVEYTLPPLVAPGQTPQAVGLFDPVGTGAPQDHDRRLPPSVISGFQITAEDERRNQFKSSNIIDPGMSENNHFLNITVAGAHSNIGGTYLLNGLGIRSGNLMTDYLNSLSDPPFLQKQVVPTDPAMNVVHLSEEHNKLIYRTSDFDKDVLRDRLEQVTSDRTCKIVPDCRNKEPFSEMIDNQFRHRHVATSPESYSPGITRPDQTKLDPTQPTHPEYQLHLQSSEAIRRLDNDLGRLSDASSERMSASLTVLAKQEGFQRIDNVVLSRGTDTVRPGENVIIVQGALDDPSHVRAHMKTQMAIDTPLAESYKKLEAGNVGHENRQQTPNIIRESFQDQEQDLRRQVIAR